MIVMMTKTRVLTITLLFLIIITGIRLIWIYSNWPSDRQLASQGVLDLRDAPLNRPLMLDGEWLFYPERFLMQERAGAAATGGVALHLPGSWTGAFADPKQTTGYGSFRLLIRLGEASAERRLTLAIPGVVAASELFVNGVLMGGAGIPGKTADDTSANDRPYTVTFSTNLPEIEIVVHVANFSNLVQGGLPGSIQFGNEDAVMGHKRFSIAMQRLVCVVLLIHVVYAVILYIIATRQRALLTLALLMANACLAVLLTDDKLLLTWLELPYEASLKLNVLSYIWVAALMIIFVQQLYPKAQKRPWHLYYGGLTLILTVAVAVMPVTYASLVDLYSVPFLLGGFLYVPVLTLRATFRLDRDAIFLWLGFISLAVNLMWGIANVYGLRALPFYPVDMIIVFLSFAASFGNTA